jgi:hypothetical protein
VGVEPETDDEDGESDLPAAKKRGKKKAGAGRRAAKAARPRARARWGRDRPAAIRSPSVVSRIVVFLTPGVRSLQRKTRLER